MPIDGSWGLDDGEANKEGAFPQEPLPPPEGESVFMTGNNDGNVTGIIKATNVTFNQTIIQPQPTRDRARDEEQKKFRAGISDPVFTSDEAARDSSKGRAEDESVLPVEREEFDAWFYGQLTEYEQCFVLAMSVFYNAPIDKIRAAAEQLYVPLRARDKELQKEALLPLQRTPRGQFLRRLHIISRYKDGVDHLSWRDTDSNDDSEFGTRLLLYIAWEGGLKFGSQEGQIFDKKLDEWVKDEDEDTSYRTARALGTFWYRQNKHRLYVDIDQWAASENPFDWHRAAWSLDGVYKIERVISKDASDNIGQHVLAKLREWSIKARKKEHVTLGCTAAITYAFLGRSTPAIAMDGLDTLLELPSSVLEQEYEDSETLQGMYNAVVFCYVDLAVSGTRIREVLQHVAAYVQEACYERNRSGWGTRQERQRRERQREWRVEAALDILYWISDASFSYVKSKQAVAYQTTQPLAAKATFENTKGRDLLLEGILIEDEKEWRNSITLLLCAAFVEGHSRLAFSLLRDWAECVMRDQSDDPDAVRGAYVRFIRDLACQLDTWCKQLQDMDVYVPSVATIFKSKLETWQIPWNRQRDYIPLGLLAQEVLAALPFSWS